MSTPTETPKVDLESAIEDCASKQNDLQLIITDSKFQKWSSLSINFISLLLFLATTALAILGYLQWRTMNKSLHQTIESINLTKQQVDSSNKSAIAASESAIAARQSTQIAGEATSIAKSEFISNRMVVWKANYDEKSNNFLLTANDPSVKLQEAIIYFIVSSNFSCDGIESGLFECHGLPEEGYGKVKKAINGFAIDKRVVPPFFNMDINPILAACSEQLGQTFPAIDGVNQLGITSIYYFPIPVVISAIYIAKGELQRDTSLYYIQVSYVYDQGKVDKCKFRLLDMFFVRRLTKRDNIEALLKERWKSVIRRHTTFSYMKKTRSIDDIIK